MTSKNIRSAPRRHAATVRLNHRSDTLSDLRPFAQSHLVRLMFVCHSAQHLTYNVRLRRKLVNVRRDGELTRGWVATSRAQAVGPRPRPAPLPDMSRLSLRVDRALPPPIQSRLHETSSTSAKANPGSDGGASPTASRGNATRACGREVAQNRRLRRLAARPAS